MTLIICRRLGYHLMAVYFCMHHEYADCCFTGVLTFLLGQRIDRSEYLRFYKHKYPNAIILFDAHIHTGIGKPSAKPQTYRLKN